MQDRAELVELKEQVARELADMRTRVNIRNHSVGVDLFSQLCSVSADGIMPNHHWKYIMKILNFKFYWVYDMQEAQPQNSFDRALLSDIGIFIIILIPASSDTGESEGREKNQCWIK
jgi:hypothetical protein